MKRLRPNFAFTLIEMVLVLVIISITLAMAAPSLRNWGEGQKLRNASDNFLAATGYARAEAVAKATPYSITIDSQANTYVVNVVTGDTAKPVDGELGQPSTLPPLYTIKLVSGGAPDGALMFYPDARTTPAVVQLTGPSGESVQVAATNPAEPFAKVTTPQ
ncbi:MAG: GspH/FimT family pseudopilin [Tepidisphaeraceae bacterium]